MRGKIIEQGDTMKKSLVGGLIALDLLVCYVLVIAVIYYFLLGLEPVLWMIGMLGAQMLLRLLGLQFTWRERTTVRHTGARLSKRARALLGASLACTIVLTIGAAFYLFIRFGWLAALLYSVLSLLVGSIFEASCEVLEVAGKPFAEGLC